MAFRFRRPSNAHPLTLTWEGGVLKSLPGQSRGSPRWPSLAYQLVALRRIFGCEVIGVDGDTGTLECIRILFVEMP